MICLPENRARTCSGMMRERQMSSSETGPWGGQRGRVPRAPYSNAIAVSNPAAEHFADARAADPVFPAPVHDAGLEQRAGKQHGDEQHGARRVEERDGPPAGDAQHVQERGVVAAAEHVDGDGQVGEAGHRDHLDARADGRRGVARELRRRPRGGRQVQRRHVEQGEQQLRIV